MYESLPELSSPSEFQPTHDRWRQFYAGKWYDPYNQNVLKGDIPIFGSAQHPWFFELSVISESTVETRNVPTPVGGPSTQGPQSNDTFGGFRQTVASETVVSSFSLIRGNTAFKPPDVELRFTPIMNFNNARIAETGLLRVDPSEGNSRTDSFLGVLELFADIHLTNTSDRYDFLSSRIGVQKFNSDFRGFIYNVEEPGVRIFGNHDNNNYQYNLAYFRRLSKDTNSGLNTYFDDRYEDVAIANLYRQDTFYPGHTVQISALHREDNAGEHAFSYDRNGLLVRPTSIGDERPTNLQSTYFGLATDGHLDRINISSAFYYVTGSQSHNSIAQREVEVIAGMAALELSYEMDWIRLRTSGFWASGDGDAEDGRATGFDSIYDNPNFAGGEISYFQRNGIPLIGGGATLLTNRKSLLTSFRPGKEKGQSNFVNPGLRLINTGIDFELTPKLKLINNINFLQFDNTDSLEVVRQDGSISRDIGVDISTGILYRPFLNNNIQLRAGASALLPGDGLKNLYGDNTLYTLFGTLILQY